MDFSSLVLMKREKTTNIFLGEMDSFNVGDGAEYITKFFYDGDKINVFFDTKNDVEEWEFSAIFDCFNLEAFTNNDFEIEEIEDEFNPTWKIQFSYKDDYDFINKKINQLCVIVEEEILKVLQLIKDKKEEYI